MGKKKKKDKKPSAKKEKYSKFRREKPSTFAFAEPDRTEEDSKRQRDDEGRLERFLRFSRQPKKKDKKKR